MVQPQAVALGLAVKDAAVRLRAYFAGTVADLVEGCAVYQDLDVPVLGGVPEHSGIHVGACEIVSLSKDGRIVKEGTREFLEGGWNRFIWVSCKGDAAVGSTRVAERARAKIGRARDYNLFLDNCHQFTSGCLTGNFENNDNLSGVGLGGVVAELATNSELPSLDKTISRVLGADNWRIWDRDGAIQRMCDKAILEISRDRRLLEELIDADFEKREKLLGASFDRLGGSYTIKDANGFVEDLAAVARAYGGEIPWQDAESFDDWMQDDDTVLKL